MVKFNKWNDISVKLMEELAIRINSIESWTRNKVIEIQNIKAPILKEPMDSRLYIGNSFSIFDWPEYNYKMIDVVESSKIGGEIKNKMINKELFSLCSLIDGKPLVSPMLTSESFKDSLINFFGVEGKLSGYLSKIPDEIKNSLSCWFYKDEDNNYLVKLDYSKKSKSINLPKLIRIREFDIDSWKEMINNYVKNRDYNILGINNDIKLENIKII